MPRQLFLDEVYLIAAARVSPLKSRKRSGTMLHVIQKLAGHFRDSPIAETALDRRLRIQCYETVPNYLAE